MVAEGLKVCMFEDSNGFKGKRLILWSAIVLSALRALSLHSSDTL